MIVNIEAMMNVGRAIGQNNFKMILPEGSKLSDLLKSIKLQEKGNAYELMVGEDGHLDSHYTVLLNEEQVDDRTLDREIKDHDLLIMMDTVHTGTII